ncbi:uncharacterized protein LOC120329297 [Styela clava]
MDSNEFLFLLKILVAFLVIYLIDFCRKIWRKKNDKARNGEDHRQPKSDETQVNENNDEMKSNVTVKVYPAQGEEDDISRHPVKDSNENVANIDVTTSPKRVNVKMRFNENDLFPERSKSVGNKQQDETRRLSEVRSCGDGDSGISLSSNSGKKEVVSTISDINNVDIYDISEVIGSHGGSLAIAGCSVLIPKGALDHLTEITLKCFFHRQPFQDENWLTMTPTIQLLPKGLSFKKDVLISIPAYFDPLSHVKLSDITIQTRQEEESNWEEFKIVKNSFPGRIVFGVNHFTLFRAIFQRAIEKLFSKTLYFVGYVKRFTVEQKPNNYELVWCISDVHSFAYVTRGMNSEHYEMVVEPGTLMIRPDQSLNICINSENSNISVEPPVISIKNKDIWPYGVIVNKKCGLRHINDSQVDVVRIEYCFEVWCEGDDPRCDVIKSGNGTFQWLSTLRRSSNVQSVTINNSVIDNVCLTSVKSHKK